MSEVRRVLLLAHTGRAEARVVALAFLRALTAAGVVVRLPAPEAKDLGVEADGFSPPLEFTDPVCQEGDAGADCELTVVLGGDGSILRAVELTYASHTPVLGVNLGHVGFLAEAEPEDLEAVITAIVERDWTAEDRLTLDVRVQLDGECLAQTFAVNEVSVEKAARERMIEVVLEVDERPLSRWACDGVVVATPTGSTAYNFSAGGPVVWPEVEAICVVPLSAHALFARPLVVAPSAVIAVEVLARTDGVGVMWCDGRRTTDLPVGARIEVRRAERPVRLARLHASSFTDRLVAKFDLPVAGWRGGAEQRFEARQKARDAGTAGRDAQVGEP